MYKMQGMTLQHPVSRIRSASESQAKSEWKWPLRWECDGMGWIPGSSFGNGNHWQGTKHAARMWVSWLDFNVPGHLNANAPRP